MPPGDQPDTLYALLSAKIEEAMQFAEEAGTLLDPAKAAPRRAQAIALWESVKSFTDSAHLTEPERAALIAKLRHLADSIQHTE